MESAPQHSPYQYSEMGDNRTGTDLATTPYQDVAFQPSTPDLVIYTSDCILLPVHKAVLSRSSNGFDGYLAPNDWLSYNSPTEDTGFPTPHSLDPTTSSPASPQMIIISEHSRVLDVVIPILYRVPCSCSPTLATLIQVVSFMSKYGFSRHHREIASLLISHAPSHPLQVYSIAASNEMGELCVKASQYTLAVSLSTLTDGQALMMGPIYLKRLVFLHKGREEALKRILLASASFPPEHHASKPGTCSLEEQKAVQRAWSLGMTYLLTRGGDNGAGLQSTTAGLLTSSFKPLADSTRCGECKEVLLKRLWEVISEWSLIKMTI